MSISLGSWNSFASTLMNDFQTQYRGQTDLLNYVAGVLKPIVDAGGRGYDASTLAAMRTGASDSTATNYQNAEKALQQRQAINGDADLPSGVAAQQREELAAAGASQNANAQQNITLANEQQRERSLEFGTNALTSIAHEENPLGFASAADAAGNTEANIQNSNTTADANSFGGTFLKSLGGSLGAAVGRGATMGLGGAAGVLNGGNLAPAPLWRCTEAKQPTIQRYRRAQKVSRLIAQREPACSGELRPLNRLFLFQKRQKRTLVNLQRQRKSLLAPYRRTFPAQLWQTRHYLP